MQTVNKKAIAIANISHADVHRHPPRYCPVGVEARVCASRVAANVGRWWLQIECCCHGMMQGTRNSAPLAEPTARNARMTEQK